MLQLNKTKLIIYCLFFTVLFFGGCCHVGYRIITVSNLSGKDKYYKAYATIRDSVQNIAWKEINQLNAKGKDEIVINAEDSDDLEKFEDEKRIVIIFFDSKKEKKATVENDSIVKKYSMKELENQNWKIEYFEN